MGKNANKKKNGAADSGNTGGETSLRTLVDDLRKQTIAGNDDVIAGNFILNNIAGNIFDIRDAVFTMRDQMIGDHMAQLEKDAERAKEMELLLKSLNKKEPKEKEKAKGDFSWLGLAGALISGLVAGGIAFVANYVKDFVGAWKTLAKTFKIDGLIAKTFTAITDTFKVIQEFVSGKFMQAWEFIKTMFQENKILKAISSFTDDVINGFKSFFKVDQLLPEIKVLWQSIKDIFNMLFDPLKNMFSGTGGMFKGLIESMEFLKPITTFFKSIGTILGKLAWPIQIVMSIWDTVSGAIDGWKKTEGSMVDKLFGAIKGGLIGLIDGLVGGLLDFIKDGLSWVLRFFGMSDAAEWLESFSFGEIITDVIGGLVDGFKNIVLGVIEVFNKAKDFFSNIDWNGLLQKGLAWLVVGMTAGASSLTGLFGYDFTKKALDLAGLPDPRGGGSETKAATTPQAPASQSDGTKQLASATQSNEAAKTEQQAAAAAASSVSAASSSNSNKSSVVNNNATAVMSSKTTAWDPEDMWARGII